MRYTLFLIFAICLSLPEYSDAGGEFAHSSKITKKLDYLVSINKNMEWLKKEIEVKKEAYEKEVRAKRQKAMESDIGKLEQKLSLGRITFSEVASGMVLDPSHVEDGSRKDLLSEFQDLIMPALDSFKRLSARPRKIEKLRSDISYSVDRVYEVQDAMENIEELKEESGAESIEMELNVSLSNMKNLQQDAILRVNELERQLEFELRKDRSFFEAMKELSSDFFQNRGKNLFFSIATFFALAWFMLLIKKRITRRYSFPETLSWLEKPVRALYGVLTLLAGLAGALLCLYIFNDWVLFTFVILSLSLAAWSVHNWIPRFVHEGKFVLNLGTVKEGELVVLGGIPWLVKELGVQSILENRKLQGGRIRVASGQLMSLSSRRVVDGEPWFPVSSGNWVLLADGTFGKVVIQTPEQVTLRLPGGAEKYYSVSGFLSEKPSNLSCGFRLEAKFAIDYKVRMQIGNEVSSLFKKGVKAKWGARFNGERPDFNDLRVELHSAGRNALYLWVKVDCRGRVAGSYEDLHRELQAILVEVSNQNGYQPPLTQLRIYSARGSVRDL